MQNIDLEELFFDCAYSAMRSASKYSPNSKVNYGQNLSSKTQKLLGFITNKQVLDVLHDIMFRFQAMQDEVKITESQNNNEDILQVCEEFVQELK